MARQQIAAGNWKMNKNLKDGLSLASEIRASVNSAEGVLTILAPPAVLLKSVAEIIADAPHIQLAAQNCHQEESGAYTGELAVDMLESVGVTHVIIGHSERRQYFAESNELLATKVDRVLSGGLTPIFCCGESLPVREAGDHVTFVAQQLADSLFHLTAEQMAGIVIAYEPIWAIGTGVTASKEQAQDMHKEIRRMIAGKYGDEVANGISILYGGSVKPANAKELFAQEDVDGGLVGGASLKGEDFVAIIRSF